MTMKKKFLETKKVKKSETTAERFFIFAVCKQR